MAGMDYSGMTFRNGKFIPNKSIETAKGLTSVSSVKGLMAYKHRVGDKEFFDKRQNGLYCDVIMGSAPLYVELSRSTYIGVSMVSHGAFYEQPNRLIFGTEIDMDSDYLTLSHVVGGYAIDYVRETQERTIQYARLVEPDGTIWLGFSGYHVGEEFSNDKKYDSLGKMLWGTDFVSQHDIDMTKTCQARLFKLFK